MKENIVREVLTYIAPRMDDEARCYSTIMKKLYIYIAGFSCVLLYGTGMLFKHNNLHLLEMLGILFIASVILYFTHGITQKWYGKEKIREIKTWEKHRKQLIKSPHFAEAYNLIIRGYCPLKSGVALPFALLGRYYQDLLQIQFNMTFRKREWLMIGIPLQSYSR